MYGVLCSITMGSEINSHSIRMLFSCFTELIQLLAASAHVAVTAMQSLSPVSIQLINT